MNQQYLRRFSFTFLFVLFISFGFAQQSVFTLAGTINNATSGEVKLLVYSNHIMSMPEVLTTQLKNGSYSFTAKSNKPAYAELSYKEKGLRIYTEPGDAMTLTFNDDPQLSGTSLSGKGSDNNLFQNVFNTQFSSVINDSVQSAHIMGESVDAWENELFNLRKQRTEFLNAYPERNKLSTSFIQTIKNEIDYHYWCLLLAYPIVHANSNQQILHVEQLPPVMTEELAKVNLNNEDALVNDIYRGFIYYYLVYSASQSNGFNKFNDYSTAAGRRLAVAKAKLTGDVFNNWLAQSCLDEKDHLSPFMLKNMLGALKESDKNLKYYSFVNKACEPALQASLEAQSKTQTTGQKSNGSKKTNETASAPDSEAGLVDINGKPFSLTSLKGKVVYIDFWASWCGPCKMMMPYSKEMHEKLTDKQKKDIVFLYISIDADTGAWRRGMQALGMEGTMAISPGNWSSPACRYFQINSIPRYMIMDKKGNIVDYNAKRPADPAVLEELIRLTSD